MRRPELTGAPRARVDELLAKAEEHVEALDLRAALEWSLRAWDELPTPKASDEAGATAMFRRILDLHGIQSFRGHDRRYFELAQDSQPPQ